MNRSSEDPRFGIILGVLLFQQVLGALAFPISKVGLLIIEPFTYAFYRYIISAAVLLLIVKLRGHAVPVAKKDYIKIIGLGFLIIPFNQTTFLYGQKLTAAGHGSLLFATVPIWIFIGALFHLRERLVIRRLVGVILGLTGVLIIMSAGAIEIGRDYLVGDAFILVAVIAWAMYSVWGKPLVRKYGAIRVTAYALASGTVMYLPFGLYRAAVFDYSQATLVGWLSVLYMALGTSVAAYVLWYWVLKYMDASRVAVFHNIQPIIASVVAYIFLSEPLGLSFVLGGIVVLSGVIITETS